MTLTPEDRKKRNARKYSARKQWVKSGKRQQAEYLAKKINDRAYSWRQKEEPRATQEG